MRIHTEQVLGAAAFIAPPLAIYAPLGLAPLLGIAALGVLIVQRVTQHRWPSPPASLVVFFTLAFLWSASSALWSIDVPATLGKLPGFLGAVVAGLVLLDASRCLNPERRHRAGRLLVAGFVLALVLLALERATEAPIRRLFEPELTDETILWIFFNRGATVMVLLVWPAAGLVRRWSHAAAILLWAATLGIVATYFSSAAVLAMIAGGGAFFLVRVLPRVGTVALAVVFAGFILSSPIIFGKLLHRDGIDRMSSVLPRSGYHRLLIWNFTAERVFDRPLAGWGLDTSRSIPGGNKWLDNTEQAMPLHPHNSALQIWLELGLPGALLATVLVGWILITIGRGVQGSAEKAAMTGMCVTALGISFLSYGVWQSWWLSGLWLAAAFAAMCWKNDAVTAPESGENPVSAVPAP